MAEIFSKDGELDAGMIIRRVLFLFLLIGLGVYHLFFNFRGLTHERGMDQAQIAREIAGGGTFTTKFLRPLSIYQVNKHNKEHGKDAASPTAFADINHAPLNPLLNSVFLRMFKNKWEFDLESHSAVYFLDYVIVAVSIALFLASIFIFYLLISRIFDTKIAGVTCLVVLLCSTMWSFTQSGLPQMLMLFLFSFALYFLFKAIETQQEETPPYVWIALAAGFLGLLALAHWLAIWIFLGVMLFSAIYFRPRGVMAIVFLTIFTAVISLWAIRNVNTCGNPFGAGIFALQTGLAEGDASQIYRNFNPDQQPFDNKGLFSKIVLNSVNQLEDLYKYLGSIIIAPLFFLSLLHPFKRPEIAHFRWCILSMWVFAVVGMVIYGIPEGVKDPNQIHILFSPIMSAYGLAFLTVVWNRIGFETNHPLVTQGHLVMVALISAVPLILPLPKNIDRGLSTPVARKYNWPYYPPHHAYLRDWTHESEIIISDMPWAVAWYGNRTSLWLPKDMDQFKQLREYCDSKNRSFAGILFTALSIDSKLVSDIVQGRYKGWRGAILNGQGQTLGVSLLPADFPFKTEINLGQGLAFFYSDRDRMGTLNR